MIQRLIKRLKGSAGYTLTEMTAVVATAGVLTAVMLPVAISQIQQGRVTAAAGDIAAIGGAVASIVRDTGDYPMRSGAANDFTTRFGKTLLFSTDADGSTISIPDATTTLDTTFTGTATFEPHFYTNTFYTNWHGAYLSSRKLDPWGKSYLVYLQGVRDAAGTGTSTKNLLVLSAGPNGVVETPGTANSPLGDDIISVLAGGTGVSSGGDGGDAPTPG